MIEHCSGPLGQHTTVVLPARTRQRRSALQQKLLGAPGGHDIRFWAAHVDCRSKIDGSVNEVVVEENTAASRSARSGIGSLSIAGTISRVEGLVWTVAAISPLPRRRYRYC
jgi:hypothetical protein